MDEAVNQADPVELMSSTESASERPFKRLEGVEGLVTLLVELKYTESSIENHMLENQISLRIIFNSLSHS